MPPLPPKRPAIRSREPIVITEAPPDFIERAGNSVSEAFRGLKKRNMSRPSDAPLRAPINRALNLGLVLSRPASTTQANRQTEVARAALSTALGDSLTQLSGGGTPNPSGRRFPHYQIGNGVRSSGTGRYSLFGDKVSVGDVSGNVQRQTLIHEMGHRRNFRTVRGLFDSLNPTFDIPESNTEAHSYAKLNRAEAYAMAYRNAFQVLAEAARDPQKYTAPYGDPKNRRTFLGRQLDAMEARTPGVSYLVRQLLLEDAYANHPLRHLAGMDFGAKPSTRAQSDVTGTGFMGTPPKVGK